jgi:hypothetical protein
MLRTAFWYRQEFQGPVAMEPQLQALPKRPLMTLTNYFLPSFD